MTAEELKTELMKVMTEELKEINDNWERKGILNGFDQGRSYELGVIEGSMIKIIKEFNDDKRRNQALGPDSAT